MLHVVAADGAQMLEAPREEKVCDACFNYLTYNDPHDAIGVPSSNQDPLHSPNPIQKDRFKSLQKVGT